MAQNFMVKLGELKNDNDKQAHKLASQIDKTKAKT